MGDKERKGEERRLMSSINMAKTKQQKVENKGRERNINDREGVKGWIKKSGRRVEGREKGYIHTHTHTHTLSLSLPHSHSHSHSHTHTHTYTYTYTHAHTYTHSLSLSHSHTHIATDLNI